MDGMINCEQNPTPIDFDAHQSYQAFKRSSVDRFCVRISHDNIHHSGESAYVKFKFCFASIL